MCNNCKKIETFFNDFYEITIILEIGLVIILINNKDLRHCL